MAPEAGLPEVDIKGLLKRLWPLPENATPPTADEIADAVAMFFTNQVSEVQAASLLMCLHFSGLDRQADVMAACAQRMRKAAAKIDADNLQKVVDARGRKEGSYQGGLCDIVGTGGDSHNTFNISTTSSIIASSLLLVAKHGNRSATSKSGSADLLANMSPLPPNMAAITPQTLSTVYSRTNYAFLFAPVFHHGMRYVAPIRKQLPWRTLFNLIGPLSNPVDVDGHPMIESRLVGVARKELGPVFAEAFRMAGVKRAIIVCGKEELDEVSCAGPTLCWRLKEGAHGVEIEHFEIQPSDFGLRNHPLDSVSPGKEPKENAALLTRILKGELADDEPLLEFVLINTAALFVISGICDADTSSMGPGDDGIVIKETGPSGLRWKEGVRRARWALKSGEAWKQWNAFVEVTNGLSA